MDINQAFPSNYLSANDLGDREVTVQISHVTVEAMGDGTQKPVLYFMGKQKGLVLNKTNGHQIAHNLGTPDTDMWTNSKITIGTSWTQNPQGQQVRGIRVRPGLAAPVLVPTGAANIPAPGYEGDPNLPPDVQDQLDDEIPF